MNVNFSDVRLFVFEIVSSSILGIKDTNDLLIHVKKHIKNFGYRLINESDDSLCVFEVDDYKLINKIMKEDFIDDKEYAWLVSQYYEYLVIHLKNDNILFGLISTKDKALKSPYSERTASYISSEIGDPVFPYLPSLARNYVANIAKKTDNKSLSDLICLNNKEILPSETSLSGNVEFVNLPINFEVKLQNVNIDTNFRTFTILSSSEILSSNIIDMIRDPNNIQKVEIGKAFPMQGFFADSLEQSPINHLVIKAKNGVFHNLIKELFNISIYTNWEYFNAKTMYHLSNNEKKLKVIEQKNICKRFEKRLTTIVEGLQFLQKAYPDNRNLLELQMNNSYTYLLKFSPFYLKWKNHLEMFLTCENSDDTDWKQGVMNVDWNCLTKCKIANLDEATRILKLLDVDPSSTLSKVRVIVEKMISHLYEKYIGRARGIKLADMMYSLNKKNVFPQIIYIYLNTLRLAGNTAAHTGQGEKKDVEAIIPLFLIIIDWFIDNQTKQVCA